MLTFLVVLRFRVRYGLGCTTHHTKLTKIITKTRKEKDLEGDIHVTPSPVPHTKLPKINEIHEKGDRGG